MKEGKYEAIRGKAEDLRVGDICYERSYWGPMREIIEIEPADDNGSFIRLHFECRRGSAASKEIWSQTNIGLFLRPIPDSETE